MKEIIKVKKGTCTLSCKKQLIESTSAMIGVIAELILMGGLDDFVKIGKNKAAKSLLKKYKIEVSPDLIKDIGIIRSA